MINPQNTFCSLLQQRPVHRVPVEILAEIFLLMRDSSAISSASTRCNHSQIYVANLALLCITAMCLHWHIVATNFSALWNNIVFSTLMASLVQCTELFLGYMKSCMLYIYISAPTLTPAISSTMHKVFIKISSESHRIWVFEFFAIPRMRILYAYWENPVTNTHWVPVIRDSEPALSCGPFPQVESMLLSSPIWYPGVVPCLKNLEIWNIRSVMCLSSLLHTLGGCLALESLRLHSYRQFVGEGSSDVQTLPNLYRLHLFSCKSAPILASLHLPLLTHPLAIFDSDPHEDILHHLQSQQGAMYLKGISMLCVVLNMRNSHYSVAAYHQDGQMCLYLGVSTVSHLFRWQWIHESMETIALFRPFSQVASLSITTHWGQRGCYPGGKLRVY